MANETQTSVIAAVTVIVLFSIAVLAAILLGSVKGQTYNIVEPKLNDVYETAYTVNRTVTLSNTTWVSLGNYQIDNSTIVFTKGKSVARVLSTTHRNNNLSLSAFNGSVKVKAGASPKQMSGVAWNVSYTYKNITLQRALKGGILSAFETDKQIQDFTPVTSLAFMVVIVLGVIAGILLQSGLSRSGGAA